MSNRACEQSRNAIIALLRLRRTSTDACDGDGTGESDEEDRMGKFPKADGGLAWVILAWVIMNHDLPRHLVLLPPNGN